MYPQFFGQFLVKNGYLTNQQLLDALRLQSTFAMKVGELAVKQGYLTEEQVGHVIDRQRSVDKLFGDLAVEMGFMTATQVDEILTIQRSNHIYLGIAVVKKGFLSEDTVQTALARFLQEQHPVVGLKECFPAGHPQSAVLLHLLDTTVKMFRRMLDLPIKVGTMRFADNGRPITHLMALTELRGALEFDYYHNCNTAMSDDITSRMHIKREMSWSDTQQRDCIGEFCNTVTGILSGRLLEEGKRMTFAPPKTLSAEENNDFIAARKAVHLIFPCASPFNTFELGTIFY